MEDNGDALFVFVLLALPFLAIIPASIAYSKGHRAWLAWWLYGVLLFIIALGHALLLTPTKEAIDERAVGAGDQKCPHCAEWIKGEAKVCRFCGRDVEPAG